MNLADMVSRGVAPTDGASLGIPRLDTNILDFGSYCMEPLEFAEFEQK